MLALRLVRLIETQSDRLAQSLLDKLLHSPECADLQKIPADELRARSSEIYRNLSDWLVNKSEGEIASRYIALGKQRAEQGVRLSHLVWAISATKENLREYLEHEGLSETPVELYGSLELLTLLDRFFDSALYHTALGYERYQSSHARGITEAA